MRGLAGSLAHDKGVSPAETYARLVEGLIPSATIVPAGVWAVLAIQERRYTYIQTTL
jgi:hypothetical protein